MNSLVALSQLGYSRPLVAEALKQVEHFCSLHLEMVHSPFVILRLNPLCFSEYQHGHRDALATLSQLGYNRSCEHTSLHRAQTLTQDSRASLGRLWCVQNMGIPRTWGRSASRLCALRACTWHLCSLPEWLAVTIQTSFSLQAR